MKRYTVVFLFITIFIVISCQKNKEPETIPAQTILVSNPYFSVIQNQATQYQSLYTDVNLSLKTVSTREAIVHLLNDSVNTIIVDRQFNKEESDIIKDAKLNILENKLASDGIAVVINKNNVLKKIDIKTLTSVVSGKINSWSYVGVKNIQSKLEVVITEKNFGLYELLQDALNGTSIKPYALFKNYDDVVEYVSKNIQAIGFVPSSFIVDKLDSLSVKILPIINKCDGREYYPYQLEIYSGLYPLKYSLYLYSTNRKSAGANAFSAFMLSYNGQKIFQNTHIVPVTIPSRTIQLTTEETNQ